MRGGPTYPDYHHIHVSTPTSEDALEPWFYAFCEREAERAPDGKVVVHLGLHSMSDYVVVDAEPTNAR